MNQQVQDMMALAQRGQMAQQQQGVAVGACGPMAYNPGYGNGAQQMAMYGEGGIPPNGGMAPGCGPIPIQNTIPNCGTYNECYAPFGFSMGVDSEGRIYDFSLVGTVFSAATPSAPSFTAFLRNGVYQVMGVKFFNDPGEVALSVVNTGDNDDNKILGEVDAATWNTDDCFCPVDWGCFSITNPLRISARGINELSVTTVIGLSGTCWGIRTSSYNSCGPVNVCGPGGY